MLSVTTQRFRIAYAKLPKHIQEATRRAYKQWQKDKAHPSLHFKLISHNVYSARISIQYRALAVKQADTYVWFWIGSHADYDQLIDSLR